MARKRTTPLRFVDPDLAHCSTDRRHELLGQAQFFNHLSEEDLEVVNERFREVHYDAGEWIWHQGDPASAMFIIAAGQVKLLQHGVDGKDVVFSFAGSGDLIGGLAAVGETMYTNGAQAHSDCCLLHIEQGVFQELLNEQPSIALKVLNFASTQLNQAMNSIRTLSTGTAEQRIAGALISLAEKHGEDTETGRLIQLPLPQQDLASMTGTTVETVSRILTQLKEQGLVQTGRRWVEIRDRDALIELAGT